MIEHSDQRTARTSDRCGLLELGALFVGSVMLYSWLLRFDAINGVGPVAKFLSILLVLFVLYGLACRAVWRCSPRGRGVFHVVLPGGLLFRATLVPAGLPAAATASEKLEMLRAAESMTLRLKYGQLRGHGHEARTNHEFPTRNEAKRELCAPEIGYKSQMGTVRLEREAPARLETVRA